ncbi:MAG: YjiH family protein [Neisseriaceae bacterium]|nr:YjiH family protein [Neisseriaceae bacterium]MBP6861020.1 YjiH family protein [Neisseriaceae bacterium]
MPQQPHSNNASWVLTKIILFSSIGIFLFFVPIQWQGKNTLLIDHASSWLIGQQRPIALTLILLLMAYGAVSPFFNGLFQRSWGHKLFTLIKLLGLSLALLYLTHTAPAWAMTPDMLPFLFEKLALSVGLLIPIGAMALTFLIGFGLLEWVGVLLEPIMRPLFRTPGTSAIDAVASFVGSYSIGLLITDHSYQQGRYSVREAMIIGTGFSSVSATFMIVVAKTLGIMDAWLYFFWSTLVITFMVTMITAYLPPISRMNNDAKQRLPDQTKGQRWQQAKLSGIAHYTHSPKWHTMLWANFKNGLNMAAIVAPSILAIGFIGLILAQYTPVFEYLGYVLKPVLWLTGIPQLSQYSGALASGLAEMFLPSILLAQAELPIRYIAAVTSISSILFFSGSIPCLLATKIPMKVSHLVIIWLLRTVLSLLLASLGYRLGVAMGWLG